MYNQYTIIHNILLQQYSVEVEPLESTPLCTMQSGSSPTRQPHSCIHQVRIPFRVSAHVMCKPGSNPWRATQMWRPHPARPLSISQTRSISSRQATHITLSQPSLQGIPFSRMYFAEPIDRGPPQAPCLHPMTIDRIKYTDFYSFNQRQIKASINHTYNKENIYTHIDIYNDKQW